VDKEVLKMKVLLFFLIASAAFSAGWEAVQRIPPDTKIEVQTRQAENVRGTLVSANETVVVIRSKSGEQSVTRGDIRCVRVAHPSRRLRNGVLATAIGAGIGLAIGVAVCPHCGNEGADWMYAGPLTAIGAGAGAAGGFLPLPYRTVYKSK
jgi:hypothetical protein